MRETLDWVLPWVLCGVMAVFAVAMWSVTREIEVSHQDRLLRATRERDALAAALTAVQVQLTIAQLSERPTRPVPTCAPVPSDRRGHQTPLFDIEARRILFE